MVSEFENKEFDELIEFDEFNIDEVLRETGLSEKDLGRVILQWDGHVLAHGNDDKMIVRCNHQNYSYRSFVLMDGDHHVGEWSKRGLYIGRNGWGLDAYFSFTLTLTLLKFNKRLAFGQSTFVHSDERILGYTFHGFWDNPTNVITPITLYHTSPNTTIKRSFKKLAYLTESLVTI